MLNEELKVFNPTPIRAYRLDELNPRYVDAAFELVRVYTSEIVVYGKHSVDSKGNYYFDVMVPVDERMNTVFKDSLGEFKTLPVRFDIEGHIIAPLRKQLEEPCIDV